MPLVCVEFVQPEETGELLHRSSAFDRILIDAYKIIGVHQHRFGGHSVGDEDMETVLANLSTKHGGMWYVHKAKGYFPIVRIVHAEEP